MLKGKQKKLDVNKDGKISGDDFAMLKNVKMQKKDAMGKKVVKAESGKMITEAEAPDLGGMMGAQAAPETFDRISEVDTAMAERAARRPLPMLQEPQQLKKNKPITPKERRERDIAKRETIKAYKSQMEKKTRGRMLQDPTGYKQGGAVRGGRKEIKGLRPAKMF
jgi:hypothetical protein